MDKEIKEINSRLRERAEGMKGIDISINSGVPQPIISNWLRGLDVSINQLSKLAPVLGMKVVVALKHEWPTEEEVDND